MPSNFDQAFEKVKQLVADFQANEKFYLSPAYQEQEARHDFIDKFWSALGWDVNHETQKNPYEQEVKVERKGQGASQRKADYAFFLSPDFRNVKYYVEAKKPFGDIATRDNYFQAIRYGWGSQTPVAVLHNFEQFEMVDCRYMPNVETALQQCIRKYRCTNYLEQEKFAEIYWLFSREALAGGSLKKFAETLPKKRRNVAKPGLAKGGDEPMDEAFLAELGHQRAALARSFKNNNPELDGEKLTELTQRTLDRLVFLRFLEDKHIEPQNRIPYFGDKRTAWQDFIAESRRLDGIYNGIVYKHHDLLDSPWFKVDDDTFASICKRLGHLHSPYDFNAIPIHILGGIYERFLGTVIVTTDKRATPVEKPEVRKAGGVYYTPEYIVHYIVENTVGRLIEGKTPAQIEKLRFADIACGSGSFLLGIYDCLLRYHTKYYNDNPAKANIGGKGKKGLWPDCEQRDDGLHLTLRKKREILLNNVYGVDIDAQAVEVAQLSLYLKLLQDETPASAREHQLEFHETILPPLNKNIICGNSLIGTDILDEQLFAGGEERKLNAMNFEDAFPHIFKRKSLTNELHEPPPSAPLGFDLPGTPLHGAFSYKKLKKAKLTTGSRPSESNLAGGFDAIVGNPPYGATLTPAESEYLLQKFKLQEYQLDTYLLFVERALSLVVEKGLIGLIIPNTWLLNLLSPQIRKAIFEKTKIESIAHYRYPVFHQATVDTEVAIFRKQKPDVADMINITLVEKDGRTDNYPIAQQRWRDGHGKAVNIFERPEMIGLADKLKSLRRLDDVCRITQGAKPFQVGKGKPPQTRKVVDEKPFVSTKRENSTFRPLLRGSLMNKYTIYWNKDYWISFGDWLAEPRYSADYDASVKIIVRQTGDSLIATLDREQFIVRDNLYTMVPRADALDLRFILGLINSTLLNWFYQNVLNPERGEALAQVKRGHLAELPILEFKAAEARYARIVQLVEQMLAAQKQLAGAQTDKDKSYYEKKCASLSRQIDALVYDLYGLTEDEIKIVEGATA